jgi:hypothetical protein
MSETTYGNTIDLRCEHCGREGIRAILTCPERPGGNCVYVAEWSKGGIVRRTQLHDSASGIRLQCTTLWRMVLSYECFTSGEPISTDLGLSHPLAYPPSATVLSSRELLFRRDQTATIIRAALIGLLAQGYIQVYRSWCYRFSLGSALPAQAVYSVALTPEFGRAALNGEPLEKRIGQVLADWSAYEGSERWPDCPPIRELVCATLGTERSNPDRWLAELVKRDAITQGWGCVTGILRRFEWDASHTARIQQEREVINTLSARLHRLHPRFSHTLDSQIYEAISAMTDAC